MITPIRTEGAVCPCLAGGGQPPEQCLAGRSLAMVYAPVQDFTGLYEPADGLARGTIFMELEKPFYGARRLK